MYRTLMAATLLCAPLALAACGDSPQPTQVIVQQPPAQAAMPVAMVSPAPPPPAQSELVPPPPQGAGNVVWQPGHWRYTGAAGNPWTWQPGLYVSVPPGQSVWTPGRWQQQPSGGWVWAEGHWA
jgi:hypothetical protein